MKIKRVVAKDMRTGINLIREELGEDAVILSNRKLDDGIEIVAGIDYEAELLEAKDDESLSGPQTAPVSESQFQDMMAQAADELGPDDEFSTDGALDEPSITYAKPRKGAAAYADNATTAMPAKSPDMPASGTGKPGSKTNKYMLETELGEDTAGQNRNVSMANLKQEEPGLNDMRSELKNLRGILEHQLSGLAWGEMSRQQPHRSELLKMLLDMGLSPDLSNELADGAAHEEELQAAWRHCLSDLASRLSIYEQELIADGGVIALVGPTGVGKTTTVAKLAARYALKHGYHQVALVTTDSYRIGAHEQLRTYGRILGVPVRVANDAEELRNVLDSLRDRKLVLIDTAGMSQRDLRLTEQFHQVLQGAPNLKSCVVLSANTQTAGLEDVIRSFAKIHLDGCVLTKLDECASLGGAISVLAKHGLPLAYISDGQKVPEDIHLARANNLINRATTLMRDMSEHYDESTVAVALSGGGVYADL
jgi:flagellar biosynthesis protein FlhF